MHATLPLLVDTDFPPIARGRLQTLQVNVGYVCNQSCLHCHVNAGPTRTESMTLETVQLVLRYLEASGATTLDITGGAPELLGGDVCELFGGDQVGASGHHARRRAVVERHPAVPHP